MKDFLKRQFPADGLGWKIPSLVAAMMAIVAGAVALVVWARGTLSGLLTADLEVWHLLLSVLAVGIAGVWWARRPRKRRIVLYPEEVEVFGVIWPIKTVLVGGTTPEFHAGPPACPEDRNPLGHALELEDGTTDLIPLDNLPWQDFAPVRMQFGCFKDGTMYNLTECGGMRDALKIAVGEAQGQYRTALARVRGEAGH